MIGDGAYVVADGDQINVNYPQIEPGIYQSDGEAIFGATYQVIGWGYFYQGAGLFGETTICIPRNAWAFQTTGMQDWYKIDDPPTLWLRMPDETWRNVTDPLIDTPADLTDDLYYPYQLRMRLTGPQWFYQSMGSFFANASFAVRMPGGYWMNIANYSGQDRLGRSPEPGFMIGITPFGLDSTEADNSKPWWYVLESTGGVSESAGIPLSGGVFCEVNTPLVGDPQFDLRREFLSVDLNLVRWAARAFDPSNDFTLTLRFDGGVQGPVGAGSEVRLATATGSVVDTDVFPLNDEQYRVAGQYVPLISLTGEPIPGSIIHTFTDTGSPAPQYYEYPISLPALEGSRSLEFQVIPVPPDTPPPGGTARVNGGVNVWLAFNP
jgi:hypothetical protein